MLNFRHIKEAALKTFPALAAGLLLAVVLSVFPGAAQNSQWQDFTSADGTFTFSMPAKPQETKQPGTNYNRPSETLFYTSKSTEIFFLFAGRTNYHPEAQFTNRSELQDNRDNFAKATKSKVISERFFSWVRGPGDALDALDVTIENNKGTFRQLYVVEGKRVYGLIAGTKRGEGTADVSHFFNSLKINKR